MTTAERAEQILADGRWVDTLPQSVVEAAGRILLAAETGERAA